MIVAPQLCSCFHSTMRSSSPPLAGKSAADLIRTCIGIILVTASFGASKSIGTPTVSHSRSPAKTRLDKAESLEILYVMDPNGANCFSNVPLQDYARFQLIPWVRELKDELTRSSTKPLGHDLRVRPTLQMQSILDHRYNGLRYEGFNID